MFKASECYIFLHLNLFPVTCESFSFHGTPEAARGHVFFILVRFYFSGLRGVQSTIISLTTGFESPLPTIMLNASLLPPCRTPVSLTSGKNPEGVKNNRGLEYKINSLKMDKNHKKHFPVAKTQEVLQPRALLCPSFPNCTSPTPSTPVVFQLLTIDPPAHMSEK